MENKVDQNEHTKAQKEFEKLNAIKEIIFGQNIQEYDQEFKQLHEELKDSKKSTDKDIESLKTEVLKKLDELEEKITTNLSNLEKQIQNQLDTLQAQKIDKAVLSSLLEEMAKKING